MAVIGDTFGLNAVYNKQVENVDNNNFESWPESANYGYFGGGQAPIAIPTIVNTIDRLDFSNETTSLPGNNLLIGRYDLAATSSNSYGYFAGGRTPTTVTTIDRLDFSNETISLPGKNLFTARRNLVATSSNSYGYFGGGATPTRISTIDRLDFSTETVSNPPASLTEA